MFQFKSRSEMNNEQKLKNRQPFLIQNISDVNFKSKYLSDKFDYVQSAPKVKFYSEFKDISDGKKNY